MANDVHTLTAYDLRFQYLQRNNPLKEELREKIRNKEEPNYDLGHFFEDFALGIKDKSVAKNTGKILIFNGIHGTYFNDTTTSYFLKSNSGKRGVPTKIVSVENFNEKEYTFNEKWASTYTHNIIVYQVGSLYYILFHRFGGSGCKTIFLEAANEILRSKGLKMILDWKPPVSKTMNNQALFPKSIKLKFEKEVCSEDIADYVSSKRKTKVMTVKELILDLRIKDNDAVRETIQNWRLKRITKESAFKAIQQETSEEYNDASITVKMGSTSKIVKWDEFENLFGGYDITEELKNLRDSYAFEDALKKCADNYLLALLEE